MKTKRKPWKILSFSLWIMNYYDYYYYDYEFLFTSFIKTIRGTQLLCWNRKENRKLENPVCICMYFHITVHSSFAYHWLIWVFFCFSIPISFFPMMSTPNQWKMLSRKYGRFFLGILKQTQPRKVLLDQCSLAAPRWECYLHKLNTGRQLGQIIPFYDHGKGVICGLEIKNLKKLSESRVSAGFTLCGGPWAQLMWRPWRPT